MSAHLARAPGTWRSMPSPIPSCTSLGTATLAAVQTNPTATPKAMPRHSSCRLRPRQAPAPLGSRCAPDCRRRPAGSPARAVATAAPPGLAGRATLTRRSVTARARCRPFGRSQRAWALTSTAFTVAHTARRAEASSAAAGAYLGDEGDRAAELDPHPRDRLERDDRRRQALRGCPPAARCRPRPGGRRDGRPAAVAPRWAHPRRGARRRPRRRPPRAGSRRAARRRRRVAGRRATSAAVPSWVMRPASTTTSRVREDEGVDRVVGSRGCGCRRRRRGGRRAPAGPWLRDEASSEASGSSRSRQVGAEGERPGGATPLRLTAGEGGRPRARRPPHAEAVQPGRRLGRRLVPPGSPGAQTRRRRCRGRQVREEEVSWKTTPTGRSEVGTDTRQPRRRAPARRAPRGRRRAAGARRPPAGPSSCRAPLGPRRATTSPSPTSRATSRSRSPRRTWMSARSIRRRATGPGGGRSRPGTRR
jgi:hypothetical protein